MVNEMFDVVFWDYCFELFAFSYEVKKKRVIMYNDQ